MGCFDFSYTSIFPQKKWNLSVLMCPYAPAIAPYAPTPTPNPLYLPSIAAMSGGA